MGGFVGKRTAIQRKVHSSDEILDLEAARLRGWVVAGSTLVKPPSRRLVTRGRESDENRYKYGLKPSVKLVLSLTVGKRRTVRVAS